MREQEIGLPFRGLGSFGCLRRWARTRVWLLRALTALGIGAMRLVGGDCGVLTPLYGGVAWQMVQDRSWWSPMAGDLPYFNKPPLVLWSHALAMLVLSPFYTGAPPLWVIRLPIVLQAVLGAALSAVVGRELAGARVGVLSGLMLALSYPFCYRAGE